MNNMVAIFGAVVALGLPSLAVAGDQGFMACSAFDPQTHKMVAASPFADDKDKAAADGLAFDRTYQKVAEIKLAKPLSVTCTWFKTQQEAGEHLTRFLDAWVAMGHLYTLIDFARRLGRRTECRVSSKAPRPRDANRLVVAAMADNQTPSRLRSRYRGARRPVDLAIASSRDATRRRSPTAHARRPVGSVSA